MASTTAELVARVRDLLVDSGTGKTFSDDVVIRSGLNPTAREIAVLALSESDSVTLATVGGTRSYNLPAGIVPFVRISAITHGASRTPLAYMERSDMAQQTSTGTPTHWTIYANTIQFHPIPSGVDTVYIDAENGADAAVVSDPAAITDEFGFTRDVEDALVYGSASVLCAINREPEREASYARKYADKISQLRRKLQPDGQGLACIDQRDASDDYFNSYI